jgi:hypothetical protein
VVSKWLLNCLKRHRSKFTGTFFSRLFSIENKRKKNENHFEERKILLLMELWWLIKKTVNLTIFVFFSLPVRYNDEHWCEERHWKILNEPLYSMNHRVLFYNDHVIQRNQLILEYSFIHWDSIFVTINIWCNLYMTNSVNVWSIPPFLSNKIWSFVLHLEILD